MVWINSSWFLLGVKVKKKIKKNQKSNHLISLELMVIHLVNLMHWMQLLIWSIIFFLTLKLFLSIYIIQNLMN